MRRLWIVPLLALLCWTLAVPAVPAESAPAPGVLDFHFEDEWHLIRGSARDVLVGVENNGMSTLRLRIGIIGADAEEAPFVEVTPAMHTVTLAAGARADVVFTLRADENAPDGRHRADVVVRWINAGMSHEEARSATLNFAAAPQPFGEAGAETARRVIAVLAAGAGVGAGLAAGAWWALRQDWAFLKGVVAGALYSRIRRSQTLDHETRRRILETISAEPGIHFSQLRRETELPNGVLYHHLRKLEEGGFIVSRRVGAKRRFAPAGVNAAQEDAPLTGAERQVLDLLAGGGLTQVEIAQRLGVTRQGANYHVKNLVDKGVVVKRLVDGRWRWFAAAADPADDA